MLAAGTVPKTDFLPSISRTNRSVERPRREHFDQRILVLDTDLDYLGELSEHLEDDGFIVIAYSDSLATISWLLGGGQCDAILMNWTMPQISGWTLLHLIRDAGKTQPMIILADARDDDVEETALASGATDFVTKSLRFSILSKRLGIILDTAKGDDPRTDRDGFRVGELSLDLSSCRAKWRQIEVPLSITEFRIVHKLAARSNGDIPYREIYDVVHGEGFHAGDGVDGLRTNVRALIRRIRRKFGEIDGGFDAIQNYPGFGYRWWHEASGSPS